MTRKEYIKKVNEESVELILAGQALSNAGYFMKRVLREQILSQTAIDKFNETLIGKVKKLETIESMEQELERLQNLLKETRGE